MLIKNKVPEVEKKIDLSNWPESYYEIDDPARRREALEAVLAARPDSEAENERQEIFARRYVFDKKGRAADYFVRALLQLEIIGREKESVLNRNRRAKEARKHYEFLGILGGEPSAVLLQEWEDLACLYMTTSTSKEGRGKVMGLITVSDHAVAARLREDIEMIGKTLPEHFGYAEECRRFYEILNRAYDAVVGNAFGKKY